MQQLSASLDINNASRIQFNRPVTLEEARKYLWRYSPPQDALRGDPTEFRNAGRQQRFLLKKGDASLVMSLQQGLANEYIKRNVIRSNAPVELPK